MSPQRTRAPGPPGGDGKIANQEGSGGVHTASPGTPSEPELIERARHGDADAFEVLVLRHSSYVYNLAYHLTGQHADADELSQMTFVRAFRALPRFEGRSELRTWLHRITVNLWKNLVRSQVRRKYFQHRPLHKPEDRNEHSPVAEIRSAAPGPAEEAEREELQLAIRRAVEQLPPDEKEVTVLRDLQGYAYEEIAHICRLPLGTVKSRLARARRMLRDALQPYLRG